MQGSNSSIQQATLVAGSIQKVDEMASNFWKSKSSMKVEATDPESILQQKLDILEKKGEKEGDCLVVKFVRVMRDRVALCNERKSADADFTPEQRKRMNELDAELYNIEKTMRFCREFVAQSYLEEERARQEAKARKEQFKKQDERERKERQERLEQHGEITVHREEKVIKVSQISKKTLEWLKGLMNDGIFNWADRFVFEICDRTWVLKATSDASAGASAGSIWRTTSGTPQLTSVEACLDLFWHLMLIEEFFPTEGQLTALAVRTGTPSMEEFATILKQPKMSAWLLMTKEYAKTQKKATEMEFLATLGHVGAQEKLMRSMGRDAKAVQN